MATASILDAYVKSAPSPQHALDIFKGEWASLLPPPYDTLQAGHVPLFLDGRAYWALNELGGCQGQRVLELGPLEGGHSYILEQQGAASVTSIEANTRAYLKCLIVKEVLGMQRVRFLCGDFVSFLDQTDEQYDLIFSAGVLYHMRDPVGLLANLARHTSRLYMWTHFYDDAVIQGTPYLKVRYTVHTPAETDGFRYTLHRQDYQNSLGVAGFCGGSAEFSNWISREDMLNALSHFGFRDIRTAHEDLQHPHGPCMDIVAIK
ncbi:MAG TPA: class I SAM-dependent methyltransferase [Bryobacteraceae bacterium]|nr:class I SAM-dependent methyltransferase [Bryobacteraceae bacterium]